MTITLNGTTGIQNVLGSASAPADTNTTTPTTGVYYPSATTWGVSTAGTNALYIDASQNVGIGTTSPSQKLTIKQSSDTTLAAQGLSILASGSDTQLASGYRSDLGGCVISATYVSTGSYQPLIFRTSDTERMRIDTSGNVGIGNSAANVNDQVGGTRPLLVSKSDTGTTVAGSLSAIVIGNSDTTTSNTSQLSFAALTGANSTYYTSAAINCIFGARTNGQYPTGILTFSTSTSLNSAPTEKMRIDSSGNLMVGTTSQIQSGKISFVGTCSGQSSTASFSANQTGTSGDQFYFRTSSGATLAGYITCPSATTTSYVSVSDYRLKENVTSITNGLETISALKPVKYDWLTDKVEGEGFIAHELQAIIPLAVSGEKDALNEDGSIKPQGVDYSKIVVHLVAAIQELKAEFDAYKAAHP